MLQRHAIGVSSPAECSTVPQPRLLFSPPALLFPDLAATQGALAAARSEAARWREEAAQLRAELKDASMRTELHHKAMLQMKEK